MAMLITSNTLPLNTPRTTERPVNLVQTLLTRFAIFNGGVDKKNADLETANRYAERMRGLSRAQPGDHVSPRHVAHAATAGAVLPAGSNRARSGASLF